MHGSGISVSHFLVLNFVFCALAALALNGCGGKRATQDGVDTEPAPTIPITDKGTPPAEVVDAMETVSATLPAYAGDCSAYGYSENYLSEAVLRAIVDQAFNEMPYGYGGFYPSKYDGGPYGYGHGNYSSYRHAVDNGYYGYTNPFCAQSIVRTAGYLRPVVNYYSDLGALRSWVRSAVHHGFVRYGRPKR